MFENNSDTATMGRKHKKRLRQMSTRMLLYHLEFRFLVFMVTYANSELKTTASITAIFLVEAFSTTLIENWYRTLLLFVSNRLTRQKVANLKTIFAIVSSHLNDNNEIVFPEIYQSYRRQSHGYSLESSFLSYPVENTTFMMLKVCFKGVVYSSKEFTVCEHKLILPAARSQSDRIKEYQRMK